MIPALMSRQVYACHCSVEAGAIRVGILVLRDDAEPGTHTLVNATNPSESYKVILPNTLGVLYNESLIRSR